MKGVRALAAALLLGAAACGAEVPGVVQVGAPAPEYAATTMDGDSVSLAGLRGRVVLFNIWATWCNPCRVEIPELQELHDRFNPRGFDVVGVSIDADGSDNAIREFMAEFRMTYPVWRDPGERVSTRFMVYGVPASFLIDRDGILRWRKTGIVPAGDRALLAAIEEALGE